MGIQIEFNPDLCLRAYRTQNRAVAECLPEKLEAGETYQFFKTGQRNYYLLDAIPLYETEGNGPKGRPLASIVIEEARHSRVGDQVITKGTYKVIELFDPKDPTVHFEGMKRVR